MQCTICQQPFTISRLEKTVTTKLNVPEPTTCHECSWQRQFAFRNDMFLYKRTCDLTGKTLVSHYAPDAFCPVYDHAAWYSDQWDPTTYGRDYDSARPFFEQFHDLQKQVPRPHKLALGTLENSEYTNAVMDLKNCYMVFSAGMNENCCYAEFSDNSNNSMDILNTMKSELCYESTNSEQCYRCFFVAESQNCTDSAFLLNCNNCTNCFSCVNLKNKQYCWFNEQLTKEEYETKLHAANLGSFAQLQKIRRQFQEFVLTQPHLPNHSRNTEDSSGDYIYNCKNCTNTYLDHGSENCANIFHCTNMKDCARVTSCDYIEIGYEVTLCTDYPNPMYDMAFNVNILGKSRGLRYCDYCSNCEDSFGCVGLRGKKYCILNKQYSKEEYEKLRAQIIADMTASGEWGQFFPAYCSPFGYNETFGQDFYPLSKADATAQGFRWQDNTPNVAGKETLTADQIPDSIAEVKDDVVKEILCCTSCGRNYKIIQQELDFYRQQRLPLPRKCFICRHTARLRLRNPMKLYQRQCMCDRDHPAHTGQRCPTTFETTYDDTRREIIFCKPCYNLEIQ